MKETKLEIIRINEDVISTSFVIKGNYAGCVRLESYDSDNDRWGTDVATSENGIFTDAAGLPTSKLKEYYRNAYGFDPSSLNDNDKFCVYYDGSTYYYYKHDDLGSDHNHN